MFDQGIWQVTIMNNSVLDYSVALGLFVLFIVVFRVVQWLVLMALERVTSRTKTELDDAIITMVRTIKPPFYSFVGFWLALRYLNIEGLAQKVVNVVLVVWLVYQVVVALQILIDFYVKRHLANTEDKSAESATHIIHSLSSVALWGMGLLFVLSNLGINVTSLIAGLGIGGIAFAFAAQNILGDLFSSLAIYFDKPFIPGDLIEVGGQKGKVQKIGIKTTRLKSLSGEELIISNQELTSSRVSNYGRMSERRALFEFGVTYDTSSAKLRTIPELVQRAVEAQEKTRFDRVHWRSFGDSALTYEAVYYVKTKDYKEYVTVHQEVLLGIKDAFEQAGIEMAYPTQTLYVKKEQVVA